MERRGSGYSELVGAEPNENVPVLSWCLNVRYESFAAPDSRTPGSVSHAQRCHSTDPELHSCLAMSAPTNRKQIIHRHHDYRAVSHMSSPFVEAHAPRREWFPGLYGHAR